MKCSPAHIAVATITAIVVARGLPPMAAQQPGTPAEAIYADAQANRGQPLYHENCALCHADNLAGTLAGPALGGRAFLEKWDNKPLGELLEYMQVAMPLFLPGGLSRPQNADILAFMLRGNGFRAGRTELPSDRQAIQSYRLLAKNAAAAGTSATAPTSAVSTFPADSGVRFDSHSAVGPATGNLSDRFFSDAQAERGRVAFNRNCAACHSVDPKLSTPKDWINIFPRTYGGHYLEERRFPASSPKTLFPSVYYFWAQVERMPPWGTTSVSSQTKADIVAYILQANGFPAGSEELTPDTTRMKEMMIHERDFQRVFNGRDFTGIQFVMGPNCTPAPRGCGSKDPGSVVTIKDRALVCAPVCRVFGIWYTEQQYLNFTLRFDYRFDRPQGWDETLDDDLYCGQSGYFLFVPDEELRVYPPVKNVVDGLDCAVLDPTGQDLTKATVDEDARRRVRKRLGEWNSVEIVSKNNQVRASLNGTLITTFPHNDSKPGHIVFQLEGAAISWRNIRIKPE